MVKGLTMDTRTSVTRDGAGRRNRFPGRLDARQCPCPAGCASVASGYKLLQLVVELGAAGAIYRYVPDEIQRKGKRKCSVKP
jgi:hypothetical protein